MKDSLEDRVKKGLVVGGTLIAVSLIPDAAALGSKLVYLPLDLVNYPELARLFGSKIPTILFDASEKWYTLGGIAAGFGLMNRSQAKGRAIETLKKMDLSTSVENSILGGSLFTLAVLTGDNLARSVASIPLDFLTGLYDICYTTAGAGITAAVIAAKRSKWQPVRDAVNIMDDNWKGVKRWTSQTKTRKAVLPALALMTVGYQFLPETTKALLNPKTIVSGHGFTSGPSVLAGEDERLLGIWNTYHSDFQAAGRKHNVDPYLLAGLAAAESSGNRYAVSTTGAKGVLQLIPGTAERMGLKSGSYNPLVHNAWSGGEIQTKSRLCRKGAERMCDFVDDPSFNPSKNIEAGARYLEYLVKKRGNIRTALIGTNPVDRKETYRGRYSPSYYKRITDKRDRIRQLVSRH